MEVAGLAIGVPGLVGQVTAVVQALEYIQFGRSFGKDFGRAQLKIDLLGLRLSRWSESIIAASNSGLVVSQKEIKLSNRTLCQIHDLLESTKALSEGVPKEKEDDQSMDGPEALQVYEEDNLQGAFKAMHLAASEVTKRRQRKTSLVKKTRWAMFDKKRFDEMISDLDFLISNLENTIISSAPSLQEMVRAEVEELRKRDNNTCEGLVLLRDVNNQDDTRFEEATMEAVTGIRGHTYSDTTVSENAMLQQGDHFMSGFSMGTIPVGSVGSHRFQGTKIMGNAKAHQGDLYGGSVKFEH
jgi:hypothetical protein